MMGITYAIIEEKYDHLNGYRVSYGIAMYSSVKKGKEASLVDSIHDITSDKKKLENSLLIAIACSFLVYILSMLLKIFLQNNGYNLKYKKQV